MYLYVCTSVVQCVVGTRRFISFSNCRRCREFSAGRFFDHEMAIIGVRTYIYNIATRYPLPAIRFSVNFFPGSIQVYFGNSDMYFFFFFPQYFQRFTLIPEGGTGQWLLRFARFLAIFNYNYFLFVPL